MMLWLNVFGYWISSHFYFYLLLLMKSGVDFRRMRSGLVGVVAVSLDGVFEILFLQNVWRGFRFMFWFFIELKMLFDKIKSDAIA